MQAMHDLFYHGTNLSQVGGLDEEKSDLRVFLQYDHNEFPGVVPRTFTGATIVTALATPALALMRRIDAPKYCGLIVGVLNDFIIALLLPCTTVRATLAFLVWMAWRRLYNALAQILGKATATWMAILTLTQFHFAFYASRPLSNTFALVPCERILSIGSERYSMRSSCSICSSYNSHTISLGNP